MTTPVLGRLSLRENWEWMLIATLILIMPLGNAAQLIITIMAAIGMVHLYKTPAAIANLDTTKQIGLLFLMIWLPILIAFPGAVNLERSGGTVLYYLRYPLAGIFFVQALATQRSRERLLVAVTLILAAWCIDGLLQKILGYDLLGFPLPEPDRVNGVFHERLKFGLVIAPLFPIFVEGVRHLARRNRILWLLVPSFAAVVYFTGSRSAWTMFAVAVSAQTLYLFTRSKYKFRWTLVGISMALALMLASNQLHIEANKRLQTTLGLFSGNYTQANQATAYRLPIWRTGLHVFSHHWLIGIGPGGFRYVYTQYADDNPDDPFRKTGVTHPHLHIMEVMVETGIVGVIGYFAFLGMLLRWGWRENSPANFAFIAAVIAAAFPLNAGISMYGSYMSTIVWWLIGWMIAVSVRPAATVTTDFAG